MKNPLIKFAKQDVKIARVHGSVMVCQCKVFGETSNVTINRTGDDQYEILWSVFKNAKLEENSWKGCNEQQVINFLLDAYDVTEVA